MLYFEKPVPPPCNEEVPCALSVKDYGQSPLNDFGDQLVGPSNRTGAFAKLKIFIGKNVIVF